MTRDLFDEPAERDESADRPADPPVSVGELVGRLRARLGIEFGHVCVAGEIGSLYRSRLGHWYFDLKDAAAQLRSVLFRSASDRLAFEPEEGMQVVARGRLDVYPERGVLQLVVEDLVPSGEGALRAAFEQMKRRRTSWSASRPAGFLRPGRSWIGSSCRLRSMWVRRLR